MKASVLKKVQSDPTAKEQGVWVSIVIPDVADPLRLKIRSLASNAVREWDIRRTQEQRAFYIGGGIPPLEVLNQNEIDKLAEVLILDWNITDDVDVPVPCTKDNVRALMTELTDTRKDVLGKASQLANFRAAEIAAIVGNSDLPSQPASTTAAEA